jgi:hypothetical protein
VPRSTTSAPRHDAVAGRSATPAVVLELDAETAARLLGIGRSACSMRLARALEKLAERMSPHAVA